MLASKPLELINPILSLGIVLQKGAEERQHDNTTCPTRSFESPPPVVVARRTRETEARRLKKPAKSAFRQTSGPKGPRRVNWETEGFLYNDVRHFFVDNTPESVARIGYGFRKESREDGVFLAPTRVGAYGPSGPSDWCPRRGWDTSLCGPVASRVEGGRNQGLEIMRGTSGGALGGERCTCAPSVPPDYGGGLCGGFPWLDGVGGGGGLVLVCSGLCRRILVLLPRRLPGSFVSSTSSASIFFCHFFAVHGQGRLPLAPEKA
ncbi:uncharacterized protein LY89DRAFT_782985 [Mollisia scopiformis]|uniref:Uncharacterized protein n=1 Tax=Mollisia scopiformis TaxID=149040 RepID=A0A194X6A0_MOLSC|nr:uncharacterized protein LY89DRAFT_782985 [Mollisia scopiformis]KUJ15710.1 hypothetical protein LY89DRAFT_782985 [Mollisia scopiformis]